MNCKPGDMARIVISADGNLDKLVHVESASVKRDGGKHWWIATALQPLRAVHGDTIPAGALMYAADDALRPIRDPGDDARDETLGWLPVPQPEAIEA